MPTPDDVPENVTLEWLARHLVAMRDEFRLDLRSLREDVRALREDMGVVSVIAMRIDRQQTAMRDDIRTLFRAHRELRERVENNIHLGPTS